MSPGQGGETESEAHFPLVTRLAGNTPLEVQLRVRSCRAENLEGGVHRVQWPCPQALVSAHSKGARDRFIQVTFPSPCSANMLRCTVGLLAGYEVTANTAEKRDLLGRLECSLCHAYPIS